jgi:hypothetical protein
MRCVAKLAVAVMCAGLTSIGAAPAGGEQEPAGWSEAHVLYRPPAGSRTVALDGRVAVCGETVHAVWNHDDRIFWSCSRDDGTWTTPEVLSERSTLVGTPDLAASGSEVHLVWDEFFHIKYRRFDGSQWGPAETLPRGTDSVVHPCVAIVEETPWVIWKRYEPALLPDAGGGTSRLRYSFRSSSGWRGP